MRRFDKKKNMVKANILAEQRYLESKGVINEGSARAAANRVIPKQPSQDEIEKGAQDWYDSNKKPKSPQMKQPSQDEIEKGAQDWYDSNKKPSEKPNRPKLRALENVEGEEGGEVSTIYNLAKTIILALRDNGKSVSYSLQDSENNVEKGGEMTSPVSVELSGGDLILVGGLEDSELEQLKNEYSNDEFNAEIMSKAGMSKPLLKIKARIGDMNEGGDGNTYYDNLKSQDATRRPPLEWMKNNLGDSTEFVELRYPKPTSTSGSNYKELMHRIINQIKDGSDKIHVIYGKRANAETGEEYIHLMSATANINRKEEFARITKQFNGAMSAGNTNGVDIVKMEF